MNYYQWLPSSEARRNLAVCKAFPDGIAVDIWAYSNCNFIADASPVPFEVFAPGNTTEFNYTAFGGVVVSTRVADIISEIAPHDIQRIPVLLEGESGWELLNTLTCVECIDYEKSVIDFYPEDFSDPMRAGKPRGVRKLVIHPDHVASHHIFRVKDWMVAEIVSETLKTALERSGVTGVAFRSVN